jgi:anti-sigma factor RsiW
MNTSERDLPARIDCETAARALYDYLDGRLAPPSMTEVHGHIETCRNCASHFDFARRVLSLVPSSLPLESDSSVLHTRIVESLKAEGFQQR